MPFSNAKPLERWSDPELPAKLALPTVADEPEGWEPTEPHRLGVDSGGASALATSRADGPRARRASRVGEDTLRSDDEASVATRSDAHAKDVPPAPPRTLSGTTSGPLRARWAWVSGVAVAVILASV